MKVMGFSELVLVQPRFADVLCQEETVAMASGAADILVRARIVPTLEDALEGMQMACATAMTPRDFGPPTVAPRAGLPELLGRVTSVAFVFGSERLGLSNEDVQRCNLCLSIPARPDFGSLNLAQAVQLIAYEWRETLGAYPVVPRTRAVHRAGHDAVAGALEQWREVLVELEFLDPHVPRKLMSRLRQMLLRAEPTVEEIHILRGIARAVKKRR
jgi:tRNA/rRNA methyltransferase